MSLDVALDIIGTLRMMKIDEISEEKWKIHSYLPPSVHFKVIP